MLTHAGFLKALEHGMPFNVKAGDLRPGGVITQAHIGETIVFLLQLIQGQEVRIYRGDLSKMNELNYIFKPKVAYLVPRIMNKIHSAIINKVAEKGKLASYLLNKGIEVKKKNMKKNIYTHWFWDRLLFNKIRDMSFGSYVICGFSGAAPQNQEILNFMKALLSVPFINGYGMTEQAVMGMISHPLDESPNSIGGPNTT